MYHYVSIRSHQGSDSFITSLIYVPFQFILLQIILNNDAYLAGDYDSIIPGVYGEPNLSSDESSREVIPLLQKLIKVIEESGPPPQLLNQLPPGVQFNQGTFGVGGTSPSNRPTFGADALGGSPARRLEATGELIVIPLSHNEPSIVDCKN